MLSVKLVGTNKMSKKEFPEPKPRTIFQNATYLTAGIILLILGIHGFATKNTIMIFGDQSKASQYYGFAFAYLVLGALCSFSAFLDIKSYKANKALYESQTENQ